ncbi:MAG: deoxyribodipyrimidine photo-lyase [Candidatus Saccharibacteria bacterium]|nr:deoxyribodipyrimidine photo-lyase [Candidatus Saccharibacteria bacterium]
MDTTRVQKLNTRTDSPDGKCVLYVMSRDQRVADNHALIAAQQKAIEHALPLAVIFCLQPKSGNRSREHFEWMLEGLREVETQLSALSIPFLMLIGDAKTTLPGLIHHTNTLAVYFDMNPLRGPRKLQKKIAEEAPYDVFVVDTHNVVPIWTVSEKQEYAARTIRTKLSKLLPQYISEPQKIQSHPHHWPGSVKSIKTLQPMIDALLEDIPSNGQTFSFKSGEVSAHDALHLFISKRLSGYAQARNDPHDDGQSGLSPYLHFGQLSRLRATLEVEYAAAQDTSLRADADVFLEELNVRSSLSDNYCYYNSHYDSLLGAPDWAQKTLAKHADDVREFDYTLKQLEDAQTHDPAWNAAQTQLVRTGKMHGYMRMYWAKKVLEWTKSPEDAHRILIRLNDFYSLDGGDPNGYVGILWSIAGLHDRPWFERPVYGTIRYMNYNGLKRKFLIDQYEKLFSE